jgi:hypothetical protein
MSHLEDEFHVDCSRFDLIGGAEDAAAAPRPARRTKIDRREVARLFAAGASVEGVAHRVGCSRRHVWRILRASRRLDRMLMDAQTEVGTDASLALAALRPAIAARIGRLIEQEDTRVLLWAADRLQVFQRPGPLPSLQPRYFRKADYEKWRKDYAERQRARLLARDAERARAAEEGAARRRDRCADAGTEFVEDQALGESERPDRRSFATESDRE